MDKYAKERPLRIARILYEQTDEDHSLTTMQIMHELQKIGISTHRQTVKSDIQLLQKCGLGIREVKSSQNKYSFISHTFDPDELTLLIDAVASSKFITGAESRELEEKLRSLASGYQRPELKRNISCENRVKQENEGIRRIIDTINEAINENKQISFQYFHYNRSKDRNMENNGIPCIVTPLRLVWNGDFYYMIGVNADQSIRTFRIDHIADCLDILEEKGKKPGVTFHIDRYLNTPFHILDSVRRSVDLVCDNDVMDAVIDRFGVEIEEPCIDENTFTVTVNVPLNNTFYSWVFSLGGKVRISFPKYVRDAYADMVRHAAEGLEKGD